VSDPAVVARVAARVGLDGDALVEAAGSAPVKQRLRDATDAALRDGVWGVPTVLVDGETFWGFDDFAHLELFLDGRDPLLPGEAERLVDYAASARRRRPDE